MYVPKSFAVEDSAALVEFIKREPFGILISSHDGKPFATHVPFIVETAGDSLKLGIARRKGQSAVAEYRRARRAGYL